MSSVRLWHSALLFILASAVLASERPPANYQVILEQDIAKCKLKNDNNSISTDIQFKWMIDGHEIQNEKSDTLRLLEHDAVNNINELECYAHSNEWGMYTSYAFLHLVNASIVDR